MTDDRYNEKRELISLLKTQPYLFGRLLGFDKLTPLNNEWIIDMVYGKDDETLQAHRIAYKTTCVSVALTLIVILYPNDRTKFFRKTDTAVKEIVRQVSLMLKHSVTKRIVKALYGVELRLIKDSALEINTNLSNDPRGTAQLCAAGIKSSMTGQHYDRIFTDDIVTLEDRTSRAEREATILSYYELQNIKNPDGRIFNTGTPWHKNDAFEVMPAPKKFTCYDTGLMTEQQIAEIKRKMTPSLFAANYELKHIADDDVLFTDPITGADISLINNGVAHVDAAYYGEDYTAFTIVAIHDGKFYVFGKCWRKHIDDCMDEIMSYYNQYLCSKLYTETNADKGYSARELKKKGAKVSMYHEDMNKHLKISTYLKGDWENVVFVEGTDEKYIDQICDYNEDAEHDDCPDSLSCLIRKLKKKRERGDEVKEYHSIIGL